MEVDGQSESKRFVEVKMAGIQRNGSGAGTCSLEVVLAEGRRIEVRRDFDAETLARLIRTLEAIGSSDVESRRTFAVVRWNRSDAHAAQRVVSENGS